MFPPEIQRCISELQPLQAKLLDAENSSRASLGDVLAWESECKRISLEMRSLVRQHGYPDTELGEASADASLRMSVLLAILRRAPDGQVSREAVRARLDELRGLYRQCDSLAPRANFYNQQLTIDYAERLRALEVIGDNLERYFDRSTNPLTQTPPKPSGGCYIATAVYGSYDAPAVLVLRRFRDQRLLRTMLGRVIVRAYYTISPRLAHHFVSARWLNKKTRWLLDRIVAHLIKREGRDSYRDPLSAVAPSSHVDVAH